MLNYSKKLDRKILIPILIILAVFFLATSMQTDFAATVNVNNSTDGGGIIEGLNNANNDDKILLEEGNYTGTNNTGLTINKNITIQGNGPREKVIIDAQKLNRIFSIGNDLNVTFINITFLNGNSSGGAIYCDHANLFDISEMNIINCIFKNNNGSAGGAIDIGADKLSIINSEFINNTASIQGGAIVFGYNHDAYSIIIIKNSNFINNSAFAGSGGAIITYPNIQDQDMIISDCNFINNTAGGNGGAIHTQTNYTSITNSNFTNNSAINVGGAICDASKNSSNISNNMISDNKANRGGGIYTYNEKMAIYNNNTISYNQADEGAAIYNQNSNVTVSNSNINNNTANGNVILNEGNINIHDSIIMDNMGNIINDGSLDYNNYNIMDIVQTELSIINVGVSFNRVTITVKAVDENGNLIIGKTINFYVNGILVGNAVTDSDGIAEFSYNVSNYGVQNIIASLDEFNETFAVENITDFAIRVYSAATNTTSINVAKTNTNATIIVSNATTGKQTTVSGVLVDENGNIISGASLNVVIGSKSYSVVTSADGTWELPYTPSKAGNYNAKVYYSGDFNYLASTGSVAYTVAQEQEDTPTKVDIRLVKRNNSKAVRHGNVVYMKWLTFKNFGASGSQTINAKIIIKNLKYKLWKVYNKKLNYKFAKNNIKFKLNLKSNGLFKLKLKVYRPIKQK